MPKRILDSSKLIRHWRRYPPGKDRTPEGAEEWARELIRLEQTDAIVTPVELELLGGDCNGRDRGLTLAYLRPFRIIDGGTILPEDWNQARRLVERIPRGPNPRPRGLVDCLIRAIADRLNYETWTGDKGFPRSSG